RISQNCVTTLWLLAHDPDGDQVRCRFGQAANVDCELCYQHPNVTLNEVSVGLHVFELVIEDFPMQTISLSYEDGTSSVRLPLARDTMNSTINSTTALSRLPLHFAVEVDSPVSTCVPGIVRPQFLPPTPAHGDVYHAVVAHEFQFLVRAQAAQATIHDFQVSGPLNITKSGQSNSTNGIHQVLISWTPEESECSNHVSICFAAETFQTCNKDNTIVVYPSSPSEFRFGMEAFKFIGEFNEVYISCTVILCQAGNPFTRCAQGCSTGVTAGHHRHRRQVSAETRRHSISQWPLHLARSLGSAGNFG
ncbi:CUZD1 protein, partial [Amia calva]|nr:CUZD1 protein [Amia calva]